jgi:hypothetical protein
VIKTLKLAALLIAAIGLAVFAFFGFAIWVFIPMLPAGIIFLLAVAADRRRAKRADREAHEEHRQAA